MSVFGSLEDLSFPDILQIVHLSRQTGTLVLTGTEGERRIRFRNGLVCDATLGRGDVGLEDLLLQRGLVAPAALGPARARRARTGESLASALIAVGAVSQSTVERIVRDEIRSVLRQLIVLQEGEFRFELEATPADDPDLLALQEGLDPGSILDGATSKPALARGAGRPAQGPPGSDAETRRILLVTDRAFLRSALREEFGRHQLEVELLTSAAAALAQARSLRARKVPIGLVCDLVLPGQADTEWRGGFDLVRGMRDLVADLPAVVIGEVRDSSATDAAMAVGAAAYIPIPEIPPAGGPGDPIMSFCAAVCDAIRCGPRPPRERRKSAQNAIRVGDPLSLLHGLIREMSADGEAEIPLLVLRLAAEYFERGILFSVSGMEAFGTGAFGPEVSPDAPAGLEDRIRGVQLTLENESVLRRAIDKRETVIGEIEANRSNEPLLEKLGSSAGIQAAVLPLSSGREVFGILYGDNAVSGRPLGDLQGLEIFLSQAGIALQNALLKRRIASITTAGAGEESSRRSVPA